MGIARCVLVYVYCEGDMSVFVFGSSASNLLPVGSHAGKGGRVAGNSHPEGSGNRERGGDSLSRLHGPSVPPWGSTVTTHLRRVRSRCWGSYALHMKYAGKGRDRGR